MTQTPAKPQIGDKMPDDTVYAGVSKTTGQQMFIGVRGGKGQGTSLTFNETQEALKNLAEHGHHYRLPTKEELPGLMRGFNNGSTKPPVWTEGLWEPKKEFTGSVVCMPANPSKGPPKP